MRGYRAFLLLLACSCASSTDPGELLTDTHEQVTITGPLTLSVNDFPASLGVFWALPNAVATPKGVVVSNTRYGSLCRLAVSATSTNAAGRITLDVYFVERTTSCKPESRALSYRAETGAQTGTYDVYVVHHDNSRVDTLVHQSVKVP